MESINLINPINLSLANIKESLFGKEIINIGNERFLYGTFESEFQKFYIENKRIGNEVFKLDFFNSKLENLNKLENEIVKIERQSENLQFTSTLENILKIKNILSELISNEKQPLRKIIKTILTYKKIVKEDKINSLFSLLKSYNLIDKKTSFKDFSKIFNNINVTELVNPIIWQSSNASELLYFIIKIQDVIIEKKKRQDYLQLKSCFFKQDGIPFSENFKNIFTELETKLSKDKQSIIDKIVQEITK